MKCTRCNRQVTDEYGFCECGYKNKVPRPATVAAQEPPAEYRTAVQYAHPKRAAPRYRDDSFIASRSRPVLIASILGAVGFLAAILYTSIVINQAASTGDPTIDDLARAFAGAFIWGQLRPLLIVFALGVLSSAAAWLLREKWLLLAATLLYLITPFLVLRYTWFILPALITAALAAWKEFQPYMQERLR